jgi:hypothetical protein
MLALLLKLLSLICGERREEKSEREEEEEEERGRARPDGWLPTSFFPY